MDADREQLERIRSKAYAIVEADPGGPNADQARRILSKLPKINVGRKDRTEAGPQIHGELSASDIEGSLPPTPDEAVGIENRMAGNELGPSTAAFLLGGGGRQLLRGADKMLTFGLGQKLATKGGRAISGIEPYTDLELTAKADAEAHPDAMIAGELAALLTGKGLAGMAGRAGMGAFRGIANAGRGFIGRTVAGGLAGAGANAVAMPLIAGGQEAVEQALPSKPTDAPFLDRAKKVGDVVKGELTNPANYIAGGLFGAGSGVARGIRESGQAGRDIRLVEKYGATPSPRGPRGDVFETPLFQGLEGTAREQGAVSRYVGDNVLKNIAEEEAALGKQYATSKAEAEAAGQLEGRVDPMFVREEADRLMRSERLTDAAKNQIQREVVDALERHPNGMTVDDFNDFRGKLGDIFGIGPSEARHPAIDSLRRAAKRTVDETEMGPINEAYSKGKERIQRMHEQLGVNPESRQDIKERSLANTIDQRSGQERTAGIRSGAEGVPVSDRSVEQFLEENPRYRQLFDLPELLAAKERMTLGIEPEAGFHRRMGSHVLHKNIEPALVGAYRLLKPAEKLSVPAAVAARYLLTGGVE